MQPGTDTPSKDGQNNETLYRRRVERNGAGLLARGPAHDRPIGYLAVRRYRARGERANAHGEGQLERTDRDAKKILS